MVTPSTHPAPHTSELRFWACFAVVMALLSQVLFPAQVMAQSTRGGTRFVLCTEQTNAAPVVDITATQLFKNLDHKRSSVQGLKCANCVLASITAITPPTPSVIPVTYATTRTDLIPAPSASPVKARAPPRPYSCGPPSEI